MCPSQLSLCALIKLIIVWFLINLLNSLFVLILHVLFNSLVDPNILLNIFFSKTGSFCSVAQKSPLRYIKKNWTCVLLARRHVRSRAVAEAALVE
jgi:hypothetical protein